MIENIKEYFASNSPGIFFPDEMKREKILLMKVDGRQDKTGMVSFLVFLKGNHNPVYYVKTTRNNGYRGLLEKEFSKLKNVRERLTDCQLKENLPRPIIFTEVNDFPLFITTVFCGRSLAMMIRGKHWGKKKIIKKYLSEVLSWLIKFQKIGLRNESSEDFFSSKLTDTKLLEIDNFYGNKYKSSSLELINRFQKEGSNQLIPVTACNGDFHLGNVISNKRGFGIIDWEDYLEKDCPLLDFYHLFIATSSLLSSERIGIENGFRSFLLNPGWFKDLFFESVIEYTNALNINLDTAKVYFPYCLLAHVIKEFRRQNYNAAEAWLHILDNFLYSKASLF